MRGSYEVIVQNSLVQYKLLIRRNITIIRGDSATGKSTLVDLIRQYNVNGEESGVYVSCKKECTILTGVRWHSEISGINDSIVFIDEGFDFIASNEFAEAIKNSNNYYVIATRESLFNLPYSIVEVYGLKNVTRRSKYQEYDRLYSTFYPMYGTTSAPTKPDTIIIEDSNAGYEFFSAIAKKEGIQCISAKGKSNIYKIITGCENEKLLVIADGAAFGSEMERVLSLSKIKNVMYFLPESFEWLLLKSGLIDGNEVKDILNHPYDFIDSEKYYNWERFFTRLVKDETKGTYLQYNKKQLNPNYLHDKEISAIRGVIDEETGGKL